MGRGGERGGQLSPSPPLWPLLCPCPELQLPTLLLTELRTPLQIQGWSEAQPGDWDRGRSGPQTGSGVVERGRGSPLERVRVPSVVGGGR